MQQIGCGLHFSRMKLVRIPLETVPLNGHSRALQAESLYKIWANASSGMGWAIPISIGTPKQVSSSLLRKYALDV